MTKTVYTDGSCLKNPNGPGGWAFIVIELDRIWEVSGGDKSTTNNRMELEAAIQTLEFLSSRDEDIIIYTDSKYVINGITMWIHNWIRKDWKKVKNVDLWKRLYILNDKRVEWKWVKGHSGHQGNEMADHLATKAIKKL